MCIRVCYLTVMLTVMNPTFYHVYYIRMQISGFNARRQMHLLLFAEFTFHRLWHENILCCYVTVVLECICTIVYKNRLLVLFHVTLTLSLLNSFFRMLPNLAVLIEQGIRQSDRMFSWLHLF